MSVLHTPKIPRIPDGPTPDQVEALALYAAGLTAREIERLLGLKSRSVEGRLKRACWALGHETRAGAIAEARRRGLIREAR